MKKLFVVLFLVLFLTSMVSAYFWSIILIAFMIVLFMATSTMAGAFLGGGGDVR